MVITYSMLICGGSVFLKNLFQGVKIKLKKSNINLEFLSSKEVS